MELADCLTRLAQLYENLELDEKAELAYTDALAVAEVVRGGKHFETGGKVLDLANFLWTQGRYDEAHPLFRRATVLAETHWGPRSPTFATFLCNVADRYDGADLDAEATELYERAVTILEDNPEADPEDLASTLNNLGLLHLEGETLTEAESLLHRALTLRESLLGPKHFEVAVALNNLALVRGRQEDHAGAEELLERALAIKQAQPSPNLLSIATSQELLAGALREQGRYDEAETQLDQALSARKAMQGSRHPDLANSLDGLATILQARGSYSHAEALFKEALSLRQGAVPQDPELVSTSLNNLAVLYDEIGAYDEACALLERVVSIMESRWGPHHPALGAALRNLGLSYLDKGALERAETSLTRALNIAEAALGPDHVTVADTLDALGSLHFRRGELGRLEVPAVRARELSRAETYYRRALAIRTTNLGPDHPLVADSLNNIGALHWRQGSLDEALADLQRALAIHEKTKEPNHPTLALCLGNLALLFGSRGDPVAALSSLRRMLDIEEHNLSHQLRMSDERRRMAYASTFFGSTHVTLSLHLQIAARDHETARLAATTLLRRKGRTQDLLAESQAILRRSLPPEQQHALNELSALRSRYARLAHVIRDRGTSEEASSELDEVRRRQEDVLGGLSPLDAVVEPTMEAISLGAVQRTLPPESALVEFAYYFPMFDAEGTLAPVPDSARYAAYLVFTDHLDWVDLGPASAIEPLVEDFRHALVRGVDDRAAGRALFDAIMAPVETRLEGARSLFIAPDGMLNLVPFGALYDGRYLIERYMLHYLSTGRDLLRPWHTGASPTDTVLAVVNPTGAELPGTEQEAELLGEVFSKVSVLRGDDATETRVLEHENPRILHLATHGFFATVPANPQLPRAHRSPLEMAWVDDLLASPLDDPMLHSGLSMAIASAHEAARPSDDGRLTAYEISGWDLRGTQLVTLSGCETGLGQPEIGEGVFGLRRAFAIAGAETQVMSLWEVSDGTTPTVMAAYYRNLVAGHGRSEAMQRAQLQMLRSREHRHPKHWAGFIVSGEWAPLELPVGEGPRAVSRGCGRSSIGATSEMELAPWLLVCMLAAYRRRGHRPTWRARAAGEAPPSLLVAAPGERLFEEDLGEAHYAHVEIYKAQIHEVPCHHRVTVTEGLLVDRQGASDEPCRILECPLMPVDQAEIVERRSHLRVLRAEQVLVDPECLLEIGPRQLVASELLVGQPPHVQTAAELM